MKNLNSFKSFISVNEAKSETKSDKPKIYREFTSVQKKLYNEATDSQKEKLEKLSEDFYKLSENERKIFTVRLSKYKTAEELIKDLKTFITFFE